MDGCGTIHLVYESWARGPSLRYLTWNGHWSPVVPLFDSLGVATNPTLHRAPDGRLMLVFVGRERGRPLGSPVATMYAELRRL
jgi:hypothetical protein